MEQQIRFCTARDGARIAYAISGSGMPLVVVTDWLTHLEYDWDSPVWSHWLRDFSRHNLLVRHDVRGCGLSDWNIHDFSIHTLVDDLEQVVAASGLERFALMGICVGGGVAAEYAARHPEQVSHLVLHGSYARGRSKNPVEEEKAQLLLSLMRLAWLPDQSAYLRMFATLFVPDATAEQVRRHSEIQLRTTSPENAARIKQAIYDMDVRDALTRIRVPTLVLHSRHDAMVSFEAGRRLAAKIPGAQFVPLESRNHFPLEDEPAWGRFLAAVYHFLGMEDAELPVQLVPNGRERVFTELTDRERDVLNLMAQGCSNDEIANQLFLSQKTVRNYVSNIFDKLQVERRSQAIVLAREGGFGRTGTEN